MDSSCLIRQTATLTQRAHKRRELAIASSNQTLQTEDHSQGWFESAFFVLLFIEISSLSRIGGGNFGDGPSPPSTRKFEDFTVSTWIYFDVNAAMQSAAEAVDATRYNRRGGLRLSMTNAVYGARDYVFNFGFMNNIVSSGTVAPTPGSNPDQCLYVVMTNSAAQEAYEGRGFKVACVSSSPTNPSNPADRWYQLETQFSAVTVGSNPSQLSALMTVRRSDGTLIASETRTNAADVISDVGGNNYMWFPYNNFPANSVGFDSVELIPEEPCLVITE